MKSNRPICIALGLVIGLIALSALATDVSEHSGWRTNSNALATRDQIDAEELAIVISRMPAVQQARAELKTKWLQSANAVAPVSVETLSYLDAALDETVFAQTLSAINSDPQRPKIVSTLAAAHDWFGVKVPGYRTLLDNPDTIYRTIPVDASAHYIVTGKLPAQPPIDANFSVWDARDTSLANLSLQQLVVDAHGNFTIDMSAGEFTRAGNHLPLPPSALKLFIRNTINAWGEQQFIPLHVERVQGPALPPTQSQDELIARAAQNVRDVAPVFDYYTRLSYAQPVNTLPLVSLGGAAGRLATQAATYSAFKLADDEALIVTVNLGGAKYLIAPVYSRWMTTTQLIERTQTLNNRQAIANADGSYTFVIAVRDPKVYNWLDTAGLHEGLFNLRWQALPTTPAPIPPSATIKLVKLADLPAALPLDIKTVTTAERETQRAERIKSYASRYQP